ncbi:MAG: hypothetical protein ACK2TU_10555 [Anaerolineales bacterium]
MNKKFLAVLVSLLTVAMLALPMVSIAQAKPGGLPTEIFHDVMIYGMIIPNGPATDVVMRGNIQYGRYTAQSWGSDPANPTTLFPAVAITWGGVLFVDPTTQILVGLATFDVDYKINTNTMKGAVHLAAEITLGEMTPDTSDDGTFEGDIFLIGELLLQPDDTVSIGTLTNGEDVMWHGFFKGTGAYDGWTIVQNVNANPPWFEYIPPGTIVVAGNSHLIKPIDE